MHNKADCKAYRAVQYHERLRASVHIGLKLQRNEVPHWCQIAARASIS
jgi:hypothetical protein